MQPGLISFDFKGELQRSAPLQEAYHLPAGDTVPCYSTLPAGASCSCNGSCFGQGATSELYPCSASCVEHRKASSAQAS